MNWSTRRQFLYLSATFAFLFVVIYGLFLAFWYTPPTCTDGKKNGDEIGVDCGGSCTIVCPTQTIDPIVRWARTLRVAKGAYNSVALIENPNISSAVAGISYIFRIYDEDGILIAERKGVTFIPPNSVFAVFEGGISTGEKIPTRTTFEFTGPLVWTKQTAQNVLSTSQKTLNNEDSSPRLDATITNTSFTSVDNSEAVAIVSSGDGNAIGVSRTFIDHLDAQAQKNVVFTWPEPFETGVGVCAVPVDTVLVIDRSGSMLSDGEDPPEPLTSVKNAAKTFISQLESRDRGAIVSFATTASSPVDKSLTGNQDALAEAVDNITVGTPPDTQHTNVAGGLEQARQELLDHGRKDATKVIILLTDGIASRPLKDGEPDYPEMTASTTAQTIRDDGIDLFTVGLGNEVNANFLSGLATEPNQYFAAPKKEDLDAIYNSIASTLCRSGPATIQILTRVYPN
jgi:Mg-chelatase subunit ChlD